MVAGEGGGARSLWGEGMEGGAGDGGGGDRCPVCGRRPKGEMVGSGGGGFCCWSGGVPDARYGESGGKQGRQPRQHQRQQGEVSGEHGGCCDGGGSQDEGDEGLGDFSVSYALRYPNEVADPALEEEDLAVGEHVDPSLFVAEPCCGVEGLEIRDRASGR